jgi:putative DNA primase/helicase
VALGAVVGRSVGIHPKRRDDWLVVPNLWGGIVGRPGLMKSAAISEATKPLSRLAAESQERFQAEKLKAEVRRERITLEIAALKEEAKRAAKKGGHKRDLN